MSLLQVRQLKFQYSSDQPLFADAGFEINPGDRIGLVGPNGAGKTTLLRILAGDLEPDAGHVVWRRGLRVAYVPQHRDELSAALSAGERTRALLARCLVPDVDLLLLDEPTNHLDLRAREWLARQLERHPAACLMVSHDRHFLDSVTTRTFELRRGAFSEYGGGYGFYEQQRAVREAGEWARYETQQKRAAALDRAAERRDRLASKVARAPAGIKGGNDFYARKAAKVARTARILREREKSETVAKPWQANPIPVLDFTSVPRSSDFPIEVDAVSKAYEGNPVIENLTFTCRRGDRWAILGSNGSGKTTLLRLLLGWEAPDAGRMHIASNVRFGYYAQEAENLDPARTPVEICGEVCADRTWSRTLLACLKLPRDLAEQPIGRLSLGERAKVALTQVLVSGANVLLLDEPTNHLEIEAQEALEATLRQFPGTILFVSHDQRFIEEMADRVIDLNAGTGDIH